MAYQGEVSHFSTWNADIIAETINIEGCIEDQCGNLVAGASVYSQGIDYNGVAVARSDSDGNFQLAARINSEVLINALTAGAVSRTMSVIRGEETLMLDTCLTSEEAAAVITLSWGENPRDLDTHFSGPADNQGNSRFHISFRNPSAQVGDATIFLDVDDTSSFGPEITTVTFPFDGIYSYSVHHYSGTGDIQSSPARVTLELDGETHIFAPPGEQASLFWSVFNIEVIDGQARVIETGSWQSEDFCTSGSIDPSASSSQQKSATFDTKRTGKSPAWNDLLNKYYSN